MWTFLQHRRFAACAAAVLLGAPCLAVARPQAGTPCVSDWMPTFGGLLGLDGVVHASAVFDDGNGPALYVAGEFTTAGGQVVDRLARWDGSSWSDVGRGSSSTIYSLAVFDDGTGAALYTGGRFGHMFKWDGVSLTRLPSDVNGTVHAMEVFDDGGGPALFVGGEFMLANVGFGTSSITARRIARWDGSSWSALGSGLSAPVVSLKVFDAGNGAALYAGGDFLSTGDGTTHLGRIGRWDGSSWSGLAGDANAQVTALEVFDPGTGPALYAGGSFTMVSGVSARVASWDGAAWSPLGGGGWGGHVKSLAVHDGGAGARLIAGGLFQLSGGGPGNGIASWDGLAWSTLGSGVVVTPGEGVRTLASFDPGTGPELFAAGGLSAAGGVTASNVARWDGANWSSLGSSLNGTVIDLTQFDDGSGPALAVGGEFDVPGISGSTNVALWNGSSWVDLGGGTDGRVNALAAHYDVGGPKLYAAGNFFAAGGVPASRVAVWDGAAWTPLGPGLSYEVDDLAVYDEGSGPMLFAAGRFISPGLNHIARWDGSTWSPLGTGLNGNAATLAVYDAGDGARLIVGGSFTQAGFVAANRIAAWDGSSWSALGAGMDSFVQSLAVYDDGLGPHLYAGGFFTAPSQHVARWNGAAWLATTPIPSVESVPALAVHDAGDGPRLYAGARVGAFLHQVHRFEGAGWTLLEDGLGARVWTLAVHDTGGGPDLYVGGSFSASSSGDSYLMRWGGCAPPTAIPYCFGTAALCPCSNVGGAEQGCANSSGQGATLAAVGTSSASIDDLGLSAANLVAGNPVLLFRADNAIAGGAGVPFGDGLRCAGGGAIRVGVRTPTAAGFAHWGPALASTGNLQAGDTTRFQAWYRDPVGGPCGAGFNTTHGLEVTFGP
jgi:trimeric autotransporter adhesin